MEFTSTEQTAIVTALRVAADQYRDDALIAERAGQQRIADQFLKQAADADALYDRVEGAYAAG